MGYRGYQQQNVEQFFLVCQILRFFGLTKRRHLSEVLVCQIHGIPGMMVLLGEDLAILLQADPHNSGLLYPFPWARLLIDDCGTVWLFSGNIA